MAPAFPRSPQSRLAAGSAGASAAEHPRERLRLRQVPPLWGLVVTLGLPLTRTWDQQSQAVSSAGSLARRST